MGEFFKDFLEWLHVLGMQPVLGDLKFVDLLKLIGLLVLVVFLERILRRLFIMRVLKRTHLDPSLQFAVGRMLGYLILAFGFYIALLAVGFNLSSLAVLAGAIGVGVGFGLQNIINNFVSGLIILAERPIAIGDRIEIEGLAGQVTHISLRSTTVVTNDNISIIVPNADFISKPVTNWSHGDDKVRMRLKFTVAYGTEVEKLKRVLLEVAAENPKALKEPAPTVFCDGFGENGLNFELAVWTEQMTFNPRRFRSDLYYAIERKFRLNNIEVPFPQRELHFRSDLAADREKEKVLKGDQR